MADIPHPNRPNDDFERLLFESACHDVVPDASRRRVGLALGIAPLPPLGGGLQPARGATNGDAAGQAALGSAAAGQGQLAVLAKAGFLGLAGGVLVFSAVLRFVDAAPESDTAAAAPPPVLIVPQVTRAVVPSSTEAPPRPALPMLDADPAAPTSVARRPLARRGANPVSARAPVREVASAESRLLGEVRLLDAARNALAAGSPSQALAHLRRYQTEFPGGTLELDASLLQVRALDRAGQRAAAHRLAKRLSSRAGTERYRAELQAFVHPLASGSRARRRDIEEAR